MTLEDDLSVPVCAIERPERVRRYLSNAAASEIRAHYEGYAITQALYCFSQSPLLASVRERGLIDTEEECARHRLVRRYADGLMQFLTRAGYFHQIGASRFVPSAKGESMLDEVTLGFLYMFRGGYGELMQNAGRLLSGELAYGTDIVRNGGQTSLGSNLITNNLLDYAALAVFREHEFSTVLDLGCGAGYFLIEFVKGNPDIKGLGVDNSADAVALARARAAEQGVADQLEFVVGDCFDLAEVAEFCDRADLFYSFALEHEQLWRGEQFVVDRLDRLASMFPGKTYLIGEPLPFEPTFLWYHNLSGQGTPRAVHEWERILRRLSKATLERIVVPDHRSFGAFYELKLEG